MPPVNDLPLLLANTLSDDMGTVTSPTDADAQWRSLVHLKARAGALISDVVGPLWESGGELSLPSGDRKVVRVGAAVTWPLEEVNGEERYAIRCSTISTTFPHVNVPTAFGVVAERGAGRVVRWPLTLPSVARSQSYIGLPDDARLGVVLGAVFSHPITGVPYQHNVHDLRVPAYGGIIADYNTQQDKIELIRKPDVLDGWGVLRKVRVWWPAHVGATFEIIADGRMQIWGPNGIHQDDRELDHSVTPYINGETLDGGDLERAGVELLSGMPLHVHSPISIHRSSQYFIRVTLKSLVNAIHDICIAYKVPRGAALAEYGEKIHAPQLFVQRLTGAPPFAVESRA